MIWMSYKNGQMVRYLAIKVPSKVLTVSNRKMAEKEANNYHVYDNEGKEVKLEQSDGEKDIGVLGNDHLT